MSSKTAFTKLLPGLADAAPQIKGTLKSWAKELQELQKNPAGDEARIQKLSDNIRSTTEANAVRNVQASPVIDPAVQRDMQKLKAYDQMTKTKKAGDFLQEGAQITDPKKAAMAMMLDNPFAPGKADPLTALNEATEKTGKGLVNRFMSDSSPENKAMAERVFRNVANPMNLVGGVGLADAAMGAVDIALPDGTADEGIKRFKGLFSK